MRTRRYSDILRTIVLHLLINFQLVSCIPNVTDMANEGTETAVDINTDMDNNVGIDNRQIIGVFYFDPYQVSYNWENPDKNWSLYRSDGIPRYEDVRVTPGENNNFLSLLSSIAQTMPSYIQSHIETVDISLGHFIVFLYNFLDDGNLVGIRVSHKICKSYPTLPLVSELNGSLIIWPLLYEKALMKLSNHCTRSSQSLTRVYAPGTDPYSQICALKDRTTAFYALLGHKPYIYDLRNLKMRRNYALSAINSLSCGVPGIAFARSDVLPRLTKDPTSSISQDYMAIPITSVDIKTGKVMIYDPWTNTTTPFPLETFIELFSLVLVSEHNNEDILGKSILTVYDFQPFYKSSGSWSKFLHGRAFRRRLFFRPKAPSHQDFRLGDFNPRQINILANILPILVDFYSRDILRSIRRVSQHNFIVTLPFIGDNRASIYLDSKFEGSTDSEYPIVECGRRNNILWPYLLVKALRKIEFYQALTESQEANIHVPTISTSLLWSQSSRRKVTEILSTIIRALRIFDRSLTITVQYSLSNAANSSDPILALSTLARDGLPWFAAVKHITPLQVSYYSFENLTLTTSSRQEFCKAFIFPLVPIFDDLVLSEMSGLYPKLEDDILPNTPSAPQQSNSSAIAKSSGGKHDSSVPDYKGEPGPQEKRKCHDILFLILFVLFWIGMFVIAGLASKEGNLNRLKYGNDSNGDLCGVLNSNGVDMSSMPYLYYFNPTSQTSYRRCVSQCPTQYGDVICAYGVSVPTNVSSAYSSLASLTGNCSFTYSTNATLFRCIPNLTQFLAYAQTNLTLVNATTTAIQTSGSIGAQIFSDIYDNWKVILICSAIALGLSFFWLLLVQFFAPLVVWVTIFAVNIVCIGLTAYLWYNWNVSRTGNEAYPELSQYVMTGSYNQQTLFALAIIISVITGLVVLLSIGLRSRIRLAIALIQETSKAVRAMPLIIFFPIGKYIAQVALISWTIYVWALLSTTGTNVSQTVSDGITTRTNVTFEPNTVFQMLSIYFALGFFWSYNFLIAITETTIAGAIASWYWARDKKALPFAPIWRSFKRTMFYHLGSLAFGSLIIAIVQTIRAIILYIQTQLKRNKASKWAQYGMACLQCCFACVEKFLKFLNKNAYIEIAVYGYSFCQGAKAAFQLLVRNAVRVMVVDQVGDFLFFLGKIFIVGVTCIIGVALLQPSGTSTQSVSQLWSVPLILIAVLSYLIVSGFMAVFDMAVSTIFLCFCEDSERNDGQSKPYYMTESLKKFIDESNKQAPKL